MILLETRELKLPANERNALLIFFSKENQQLKQVVAQQQKTIQDLQEKLTQLKQAHQGHCQ